MNTLTHYFQRLTTHLIFRQLSWYSIGQVSVQLFSFLGVIVTSRYLGPTNVGLYSFVQNYLSVFMTLTIGMDFYFTWKVAKSDEKAHDLAEYFWHKVNVTSFLTILGVALAWAVLPRDVAYLATIMFVPLVLTSCTAFFQYAVATNNAKAISLLQFTVAALLFIAKATLVFLKAPLIAFVTVNALDTILVGVFLALLYVSKKEIRESMRRISAPSLLASARFIYAIRMSIIAIALWQLILRIDQLVLATFSNAYTLGIYSAAVKIAEVPNFLAGILYTALVTHVALFANKDDVHSKHRIRQVLILYATVGVMIALLVIIAAPYAISILYGSKFMASIPVLRAYALSIPGMFVTLHYFGIYGAKDKHYSQSFIFMLGLILNIALIYVLTPIYGLPGAAIATAIAYTAVALTFYVHVR